MRLALLMTVLMAGSAAGLLHAADTITIVSSLPRTGSANAQTTTMVNGMRMAIEETGGKLTLGGKDYTLTFEDWDDASPERGQWDAAVESANAKKAIANPDILAYLGTYNSGAAKVSMPVLNQAGLLMVSPANTAVSLTKPDPNDPGSPEKYRPSGKLTYFRIVPADDIQGLAGAQWAKELNLAKVFVLHDREAYGQGVAESFRTNAKKLGLTVTGFEAIDPKAANYRSLVTKMRQQGAQLVYFGGTTQTNAGQLVKDMVAGGLDAKFMCPDGCFEDAFIKAAGPANAEGRALITFGGAPPDQLTGKGKAFVAAYRERFKAEPEAYAVYGYETAKVAIEAIRRADRKDRSAVVAAAAATRDYDGALGRWSFDANGDTSLTVISGNTVKDGKFSFVKLLGQ